MAKAAVTGRNVGLYSTDSPSLYHLLDAPHSHDCHFFIPIQLVSKVCDLTTLCVHMDSWFDNPEKQLIEAGLMIADPVKCAQMALPEGSEEFDCMVSESVNAHEWVEINWL